MVAGLSASFPFGVLYEENDVSQLRPQRVGGLPPSRDAPAAPAPAALKKSLRVSVLFGSFPTPGRSPRSPRESIF